MKKITYLDIVKQLTDDVMDGVTFDVQTQLPLSQKAAIAVLKKFREIMEYGPPRYIPGQTEERYWKHIECNSSYAAPQTTVYLVPPRHNYLLTKIVRKHFGGIYRKNAELAHYIMRDFRLMRTAREEKQMPEAAQKRIRKIPLEVGYSIYKYPRALGLEVEGTSPLDHETLADLLPFYTRVVPDGSIRVQKSNHIGAEVKMLLNRATFDSRLMKVCKTLQDVGFEVNKSCGLHVHLDARHLNMSQREKIKKSMLKWMNVLVELVPTSRRDNQYCILRHSTGRYCAVSTATGSKNTIEIRLHSATTDQTKITMWIRLVELLAVLPPPSPKLRNTMAALESLPLCDWDKSFWRNRHKTLNPALYPENQTSTENE